MPRVRSCSVLEGMKLKTKALEDAYLATTYRVFLPGGYADLRIGQVSETLLDWLETAGCSQFAIITAYNPGSQLRATTINAERQSQLECDLLEGNYEPFAGENVPDVADAPTEESCFIPDISMDDACALAEDYGQLAIVCGAADGIAQLVWIEPEEMGMEAAS